MRALDEGALHRALVEQSFDLVVVLDDEAHIMWTGKQLELVLGYAPADVLGTPVIDFVHPDDRALAVDNLGDALIGVELVDPTMLRIRHADGSWRWFDIVGGMLADRPELAPAQLALHLRDVTHRHEHDLERDRARTEAEEALRLSEERHRALLRHSTDSIVVIDTSGRIEQVNPDRGLFGPRPPEQVVGTDAFAYVHDADRPMVRAQLEELLDRPGGTSEALIRVRDRDGELRWISVTASNMVDDRAVGGIVLNYRDVTARVEAEQDARRLLDLLEATEDFVGVCDPDGLLLHLNRSARRFSGVDDGTDLRSLAVPGPWVPPTEQDLLFEEVLPVLERHGAWSGELQLVGHDGRPMPVLARLVAHRHEDGPIEFFSWIMRDISERKAVEARLTHQATHDPLTGLPNRTLLLDRLQAALGRAARAGTDTAVVFVDLDHFKALNDTRGHQVGDQVLRDIAVRLAEGLRPEDTVARYGGDEFVVVLENLLDPSDATEVAGRIQQALTRPFLVDGDDIDLGASIGIALASERKARGEAIDPQDLLRAADVAMYQAKGTGRGRVAVFDDHPPPPPRPWWQGGEPMLDGLDPADPTGDGPPSP